MANSSVTTLQLLLIRSLLDRAFSAHREGSEVGDMTALLLGDIACETLLKQVLTVKSVKLKTDAVSDLVQVLGEAVPSLKNHPNFGAAGRLRHARNPVQHAGQPPAHPNVGRLLEDAREFVEAVVRESFGREFASVSSAELVSTPDLRMGLGKAVELVRAGRIEESNLCAAAVFEVLFTRWQHWSVRAVATIDPKFDSILPGIINHTVLCVFGPKQPEFTRVQYTEDMWRDEWTLLSLGFSPSDLLRIKPLRVAAEKLAALGGQGTKEASLQVKDVEFFIEVLARQIWRLEAQFPEMLRPAQRFSSGGDST